MNSSERKSQRDKLNIYRTWCKRCGNCVAFCPRSALAADEWGYPHLPDPERCTGCGLCEMLCPDFAITVGDAGSGRAAPRPAPQSAAPPKTQPVKTSPERLAPVPAPRGEGK